MSNYSFKQTKSLICPSCGATLEKPTEANYTSCSYCGTKSFVDDGVERTEHTERFVDEAEFKKIDADLEKTRLLFQEKERESKRTIKKTVIYVSLFTAVFIILIVLAFLADDSSPLGGSKISMPESSNYYTGKNYETVGQELSDLGFTNIDYDTIDDLTVGWFAKEGDVKYTSIGGKSSFKKDDYFAKDAHIVITYHVFKNNE